MSEKLAGSGLSAAQRSALDEVLKAERTQTAGRLAGLTRQFEAIVESSALSASDDEHDPEGSTVGYERAQVAALVRQAHEHLDALNRAADRLRTGSHGVCERCGRDIDFDRLVAHVTALTCVECPADGGRGEPVGSLAGLRMTTGIRRQP